MADDQPTIPHDLVYLLTTDRLGSVSSLRADGSIATHLMWIDWDGQHVLTSSPLGSVKAQNWRRNPQFAMSVVDRDDPWRFVVVRGRVTDIRPDTGLVFIDKMSMRYLGVPYRRRDFEREVFEITPDFIQASPGRGGRR